MIPDSSEAVATRMQGSSGWTHSGDDVDIYLNTKVIGWRKALKRSVVHEFNHAIRMQRTGKRSGELTLLDTVALEGLAQCFEKDVCGALPPYARAISISRAQKIWFIVKPELGKNDDPFYRRLFFATGDKDFPLWSGYTLSYLIVKRRMKQLGYGWSTIMSCNSAEIVGPGLG